MNGVHDMGGMHGLGPIAPEADEPVFHAYWEKRVLALNLTTGAGRWNIDAGRHAIERIPGPDYLRMTYYEKWFERIRMLAVERGLKRQRLQGERVHVEPIGDALDVDGQAVRGAADRIGHERIASVTRRPWPRSRRAFRGGEARDA